LTIVAAGIGLVLALLGWSELPESFGAIELAVGLVLILMAFGLWRAREWARIGVGSLSCAVCVAWAWFTWKKNVHFLEHGDGVQLAIHFVPLMGNSIMLLSPSTRRMFARVRAAMAQERSAQMEMRGSRLAYRRSSDAATTIERGSRRRGRERDV
jgi:glucose dehydrogenase